MFFFETEHNGENSRVIESPRTAAQVVGRKDKDERNWTKYCLYWTNDERIDERQCVGRKRKNGFGMQTFVQSFVLRRGLNSRLRQGVYSFKPVEKLLFLFAKTSFFSIINQKLTFLNSSRLQSLNLVIPKTSSFSSLFNAAAFIKLCVKMAKRC